MGLTREEINSSIDGLLKKLMLAARMQRDKIPYSRTNSFPNVLVFLGPELEAATQPIVWENEREKYAKMRAVSQVAKEMLCTAVILITDTRWVDGDKIAPRLGIPTVAEVGVERFNKLYSKALGERFKGYVGNMPPDWYSEAIIAVAKGPICGTRMQFAQYEKNSGDGIHWLKSDYTVGRQNFNLLPDWWV